MSAKSLPPEQQNLLDMAINSSKKRFEEQERDKNTVIFAGTKGGGKSTLINILLDRNELTKPTLAMDYCFGRRSGRSLWSEVCHIFELGGGTMYTDLLTAPISTANLAHLTLVLVLDLSRPSEIWDTMENITTTVRSLVMTAAQTENKASQLKDMAKLRLGENCVDEPFIEPFPIPLVIVGVKYDIFQDFETEKKKVICRCLRFAALSLGASLYFSTTKDSAVVKRIKEDLLHKSFDSHASKNVCQDVSKPLAIPCGIDTVQLIGGPGTTVTFKNSAIAISRWKQTCLALYPSDNSAPVSLDVDPAKDPNYLEPDVDQLREQKDQELNKYRLHMANERGKNQKKKL
ncbi:cytoplasmic dynein 2 light intermediate chain 1 [Neocloeon triangulifer]|uniref:cytoplasmic dynein 2 light intermediate chain 1 n=1 Tax=Neocloeon triangulifer TaxID=2078957 RepID=UPI00286FAD55|nr:cytoplasmic dynein 2 light intermediate chain 1 [Neocloeon triangulifer]